LPELAGPLELAAADADELAGAAADEVAPELVDVLELLLHAATVAASATPSAGAIIWRATRSNRMPRSLSSGGCDAEGCRS
jgi:hypothetical protein